ncbi:SDR family NAD(P)-dependent oxidoreductase [Bacillus salitolerans]|uniref:SDR family NAD(P)-dependent oxidoreductase n=1 Tax=Bacillus salitolerans TaxID=1437434 RepID=A0ABW4LXP5_9BACI
MNAIIITGAGTGLGRELALQYSHKEITTIVIGRTESTLKETQTLIRELGCSSEYFVCDIKDPSSVKEVIHHVCSLYTVTMLINNAGIGHFGELETMDDHLIEEIIQTNIIGTIYMSKYILPYLKKQPKSKLMNIISTAGLRGKVNESVYCASKFAVRGFTESLYKELESTPISVSAVYMGGMDTPFWDDSNHVKDKSRLRSAKLIAEQIFKEDDGRLEIHIR